MQDSKVETLEAEIISAQDTEFAGVPQILWVRVRGGDLRLDARVELKPRGSVEVMQVLVQSGEIGLVTHDGLLTTVPATPEVQEFRGRVAAGLRLLDKGQVHELLANRPVVLKSAVRS